MKIDNALLDRIYQETKRVQKEEVGEYQKWPYYQGMLDLIETLQTLDKDIALADNLLESGHLSPF